MMYRLDYLCKLIFDFPHGEEIIRLTYYYNLHARKIFANISWYSDRLDVCIIQKILRYSLNKEGYISNLNKIFGFLDCTTNGICKSLRNNNLQNANFYNHGHFIWQGVSFPDMIVIEGTEPGHFTDIMVRRDCQIRQTIDHEMDIRVANSKRLKLYADKDT